MNGRKIKSEGQVDLNGKSDAGGIWEGLAQLNQQLKVDYFIESPPLATIFAECDWKDWVSLEYPDKYRTGKEGTKQGKTGSIGIMCAGQFQRKLIMLML